MGPLLGSPPAARYEHEDSLDVLDEARPVADRLAHIHGVLRVQFPFVERVAVALVDATAGTLRTFVDSSGAARPLIRHEVPLRALPSLVEMLCVGRPRVVNDLSVFQGTAHHTVRLREAGYRASYTLPLRWNGVLWGVLFFDSTQAGVFTEEVLDALDVYAHLISSVVAEDLATTRMLVGALKTALDMMYARDAETGAHLERMARFARLIAHELAASGVHPLDDEFIERIVLFAPLHDIGKIGIPDRVLLNPGVLSPSELELMKTHAARGARIVDEIVRNFRLGSLPFVEMLRAIVELHHEAMDGTGYPRGLKGQDIPIEARIVAVADVFDALASRRRYKEPWSNDRVFDALRAMARSKLDRECVLALEARRRDVEAIQASIPEPDADAGAGR